MTFDGFPDEALVFYEGLEADNSKTYWTRNKAAYDAHVRAPLQALLDEVAPDFGTPKVFRPYRDVRFSNDKTPYKTHQGAVVHPEGAGAGSWYVQLSADGLLVSAAHGGWSRTRSPGTGGRWRTRCRVRAWRRRSSGWSARAGPSRASS